jgi:aminocarboxymuconate-semialdehyde decarboxylase
MMAIDLHSHILPASVVDAIAADPGTFSARIESEGKSRYVAHDQGFAYPLFDEFVEPEAKIGAMDRKSLDVSVLSPPPTLFYYWADAKTGSKIARLINDGIAEFVGTNPERFRGMGIVPMQDTEAAVLELDRTVAEHGFRAVEIGTSVEELQLADEKFRPFFERAQDLNVLVFAHPYYVGAKQGLEDYYLTNLIGNPLDSTIMVANLALSGRLDEFPRLKLCVAHGGGFVPYQIGRLQHGFEVRPETRTKAETPPFELMRRLIFDTILFNPQALRYLIDLVGADHVVLGSDAPFDMGDEDPLGAVDAVPDLTGEEREKIVSETTRTLLNEAAD